MESVGHEVTAWSRSPGPVKALKARGAQAALRVSSAHAETDKDALAKTIR
jgi:hypothetical protein